MAPHLKLLAFRRRLVLLLYATQPVLLSPPYLQAAGDGGQVGSAACCRVTTSCCCTCAGPHKAIVVEIAAASASTAACHVVHTRRQLVDLRQLLLQLLRLWQHAAASGVRHEGASTPRPRPLLLACLLDALSALRLLLLWVQHRQRPRRLQRHQLPHGCVGVLVCKQPRRRARVWAAAV